MSRDNVLRLTANEWLQEVSTKARSAHKGAVVLTVLGYMIGALALPVNKEQYVGSKLLLSLADRFPGCDELTLLRIAVTDTVFPVILTFFAAWWPWLQTTMSLTGEKDRKTLECLLLIPVSDKEVLLAKAVSAALPAVAVTWLAYGVTVLAAAGFMSTELASYLLNSRLLMLSFLSVPILAALSALGGVVVSISVADSKTALGFGFLPGAVGLVCFALLDLAGIAFSTMFVLLVTFLIAGLSVVILGVAVSRFDRERFLLRFK